MTLFHVSERGDIAVFEPRVSPTTSGRALVWAVGESHLAHYLLPRDCPRVCFRDAPSATPGDRLQWLAGTDGPVVAIGQDWLERAQCATLWLYSFRDETFACEDANAGYFVSHAAAVPLNVARVDAPLDAIAATGATVRVVADLRELAEGISKSTLSFSCIRMRNAAP